MNVEQSTQLAQIAFVAILFIPLVVTIGILVAVAFRLLPVMVKQFQQLIDNNAQLTKIAQQNADQIETTEKTLSSITPELVKQTNAIDAQTLEIKGQTLDFRNYQTLVSDNMASHSAELAANTATTANLATLMDRFETTLNGIPAQLRAMIDDKPTCAGLEQSIQALRYEVAQVLSQQQSIRRSTGTFPAVPITPPQSSTPQTEGGTS